MSTPALAWSVRLRQRVAAHWAERQHRNAYYLMLNTGAGAATGLLFWFILARLADLPPSDVGLGYALVALGTIVAVLAKGGLDTALLRTVPGASREDGLRLLRLGSLVGASAAVLLAVVLALASRLGHWFPHVSTTGWALAGAIGVLLVVTWLQDAHFLAEGDARYSFQRNLVLSGARLLLPLPIVALALPNPVALTWTLALVASSLAAAAFARSLPRRAGRLVPRREFLVSAARNVTGSAAEFLPGLLLAPLVLAIDGPTAAAYFGIAWSAASMLFLASAAISRSSIAEMVRNGPDGRAAALQRGVLHHVWLVVPAAVAGALLAPQILAIFGPAYAREGALVLAILCASTLFVAPSYLYLAVLRAREKPLPLMLFPAAMVVALFALAPTLEGRYGLEGVALAWLLANAPFGLYAMFRLRHEAQEVTLHDAAPTFDRRPYVE